MSKYVLYASALLAFLAGEPGGEAVEEAFPSALVSTVNMSEVITKLLDRTHNVGRGGARSATVSGLRGRRFHPQNNKISMIMHSKY